jgi:hypothetical protein
MLNYQRVVLKHTKAFMFSTKPLTSINCVWKLRTTHTQNGYWGKWWWTGGWNVVFPSMTDSAPAYNRVPWRIEMVDLKKLRRLLRLHVMSLLLVTYSFRGFFGNISGIPIDRLFDIRWNLFCFFPKVGGMSHTQQEVYNRYIDVGRQPMIYIICH